MKVNVLDVFSKITDNCKQGGNVSLYWGIIDEQEVVNVDLGARPLVLEKKQSVHR